jgi:hypothetical protein
MEMWNESEFTRIIRLSLQLFLSASRTEHQWKMWSLRGATAGRAWLENVSRKGVQNRA